MGLSTLKFQYERNFLEAWEDYETGILPYVTAGYKAILNNFQNFKEHFRSNNSRYKE